MPELLFIRNSRFVFGKLFHGQKQLWKYSWKKTERLNGKKKVDKHNLHVSVIPCGNSSQGTFMMSGPVRSG